MIPPAADDYSLVAFCGVALRNLVAIHECAFVGVLPFIGPAFTKHRDCQHSWTAMRVRPRGAQSTTPPAGHGVWARKAAAKKICEDKEVRKGSDGRSNSNEALVRCFHFCVDLRSLHVSACCVVAAEIRPPSIRARPLHLDLIYRRSHRCAHMAHVRANPGARAFTLVACGVASHDCGVVISTELLHWRSLQSQGMSILPASYSLHKMRCGCPTKDSHASGNTGMKRSRSLPRKAPFGDEASSALPVGARVR